MTPAEHLTAAENLTAQIDNFDTQDHRGEATFLAAWALTHAVIALAAELGVPHEGTTAGGAASVTPPA